MRWVRLNVDWDNSPWLFVLSEGSQLAWLKLLCHVKRDGMNGRCKAMSPIVASRRWGVGEESVMKMLEAGRNDGAVVVEDGDWIITNWAKYQGNDVTNAVRQSRYRDRKYKRTEVFERDGYKCQQCGSNKDLVVDHIIPVSAGGDTALDNLQTLCRSCNAGKRDNVTARNGVTNGSSRVTCRANRDRDIDKDSKYIPPTPQGGEKFLPEKLELPVCLQGPGGREAWETWVQSRREQRKPLTPTAAKLQLQALEACKDPIAVLMRAAREQWQGLNIKAEDKVPAVTTIKARRPA